MGSPFLLVVVTAVLTGAFTIAMAWLAYDLALKKKIEVLFSERTETLATLIKSRVTEGVSEAVEKHRDDVAAEIEDRVKSGVITGIEDGVAGLRASLIAKASEQASKSGPELMADAFDMWLKNPLRWRR